ncbi:MAG: hypothetical protein KG003_08225 [Bacteroidetes bacterium]|nr:hypothetical protein [Bacteroidota bacterium]
MKQIILISVVFLLHLYIHAQVANFSGFDSYLPINGGDINPALNAESRGKWVFSPGRMDMNLTNNLFYLKMPYSPYKVIGKNVPSAYKTENGNAYWDWSWFKMNSKTNVFNFQGISRNYGPSLILKKGKYYFSVRSEITAFVFCKGLPAGIIRDQVDNWNNSDGNSAPSTLLNSAFQYRNATMYISQQVYSGVSFGVARKFKLKRSKDFSMGVNYRLLHSMGGYYLKVKTGNVEAENASHIKISAPSVYFAEMLPRNNIFWPHGKGGVDFGFVFTHRNTECRRPGNYNGIHPDYKWKLGWSVLDIGRLMYTRTIVTNVAMKNDVSLPDPNGFIDKDPEEILQDYRSIFQTEIGLENTMTYGKKVFVGLPTRSIFTADLQLSRHLFWGSMYMQNMRRTVKNNIFFASNFSTGLRAEFKYFGFSLPLNYAPSLNAATVGMGVRIGQLYFGTGNLAPFIHPNGNYAASFYFGIQITDLPGTVFRKKLPYMFSGRRSCAGF